MAVESAPAATSISDGHSAEVQNLNSMGADSPELVRLRRAHQTKQAADGTRRGQGTRVPSNKTAQTGALGDLSTNRRNAQQDIIRKLRDIIKLESERDTRQGRNRTRRWNEGSQATDPVAQAAGNTANAQQAAKSRASKACLQYVIQLRLRSVLTHCYFQLLQRRRKLYAEHVPGSIILQDGRVSQVAPLSSPTPDNPDELGLLPTCAFILVGNSIKLGRGAHLWA